MREWGTGSMGMGDEGMGNREYGNGGWGNREGEYENGGGGDGQEDYGDGGGEMRMRVAEMVMGETGKGRMRMGESSF